MGESEETFEDETNEYDVFNDIINNLIDSTIAICIKNEKDKQERLRVVNKILNDFTYYSELSNMNKDHLEYNINENSINNMPFGHNWCIENQPQCAKADSWSAKMVPIKIISKPKETKQVNNNENIKNKNGNKPKLLKRKSSKNKPEHNDEMEDEVPSQPIQLTPLNKNNNNNKNDKKKNVKKRNSLIKITEGNEVNNTNAVLNDNANIQENDINNLDNILNKKKLRRKNHSDYNFKKPFTFDHNGDIINVSPLNPDKIPDNTIECKIDFNETNLYENETNKDNTDTKGKNKNKKDKKKKKKRKNINKTNNAETNNFIISTIATQPKTETIFKPEIGVTLKTKTGQISGKKMNSNKITNLSRTKYIELLQKSTLNDGANIFNIQSNRNMNQLNKSYTNNIDKKNNVSSLPSINNSNNKTKNIDDNKSENSRQPSRQKKRTNYTNNNDSNINNKSTGEIMSLKERNNPMNKTLSPNRLINWQNRAKILKHKNKNKKYPKRFKLVSIKNQLKTTKNTSKYFD